MKSLPQARRCCGDAPHVGGGVLDADHVLELGAARHGRHLDVDDRAQRHVVDEDRDVDGLADRLEVAGRGPPASACCSSRSTCSTASAPAFLAWRVKSIASAVELEPAPAITGTRFLAALMHSSMTCLCSSWLSVGLSPVVPDGNEPVRALLDLPLDQAAGTPCRRPHRP